MNSSTANRPHHHVSPIVASTSRRAFATRWRGRPRAGTRLPHSRSTKSRRPFVIGLLLIAGLAGIASAKAPLANDSRASRPEAPGSAVLSRLNVGTIPTSHSELIPEVAKEVVLGMSRDGRWFTAEATLSEQAFRQWITARELKLEYSAVAQVPNHGEMPGNSPFEVLTHVRNDRLLVHETRRAGRVFRLVYDRQLQRLYGMRSAD